MPHRVKASISESESAVASVQAPNVPVRERWLYRNRVALTKVYEGLAQAAKGDLHDLGSFDKFANDSIE
jgi:hypothetical protein